MTPDQAPQELSLEDQLKGVDEQLEEAHLTFDTEREKKLQQQRQHIEAQLANIAPVSNVSEIIKKGDSAEMAALDEKYAVASLDEQLTGEPLHDEHVKEKMKATLEKLIPRRAGDFVDIFFDELEWNVEGSPSEIRERIIDSLAKRNLDDNLFLTKENVEKYVHANIFGATPEEFKAYFYNRLKEQVVREHGFDPEIADLLLDPMSKENKKEKLTQLIQQVYPDVYRNIGDPKRNKELRAAIANYK